MKPNRLWLFYAMLTVASWGVWGAYIDYPAQQTPPFPETLGYVVWALVMIPPSLLALAIVGWKLEYDVKSVVFGCVLGLLGASGQLILFKTLRLAPAYLVFPYIALSPVVTIVLALIFAGERTTAKGWIGIALAVVAGVLLAYQPPKGEAQGLLWVLLASLVLLAWGVQGFIISYANRTMKAESIFFYMMLTGLFLIPAALSMTDWTHFRTAINWGFTGPYLTAMIQILNAVGALLLVYAYRYGKAMIVSPLTNAGAPVVTAVISLLMAWQAHELVWSSAKTVNAVGIVAAVAAAVLMAIEGEKG
ncbi:MAG: EamA family transporter [Pirellulales bacterium]|nr:EamA family transporter [Pirellulales bacterium]